MNRYKNQFVYTLGEKIEISGSFLLNGASNPVAASNKGRGWSVVHTGTGVHTITYDDKFVDLISFNCTLQLAALTARWIQAGAFSLVASTQVVTIHDATPTVQDVAAAANNAIHFRAVFRGAAT